MRVIAIYSPKGGVGKTTLAADLAWRCATEGGHRTLLWDLDPQGGGAYMLGLEEDRGHRAASVFQREGRPQALIVSTHFDRLSLLAADDSLKGLPGQLARLGQRKRLAQLTYSLHREFDRIVLDCPPMQNEVSDQVIAAADVMIVPLPPSPLSARALDLLRTDLARNHARHPPLLPVLAMYDPRRRAHRTAREGRMEPFPVIPYSSDIEQAAFRRAPVGSFAKHGEGSKALERLWRAIELRLSEMGGE